MYRPEVLVARPAVPRENEEGVGTIPWRMTEIGRTFDRRGCCAQAAVGRLT